jgi:hypothetical protein
VSSDRGLRKAAKGVLLKGEDADVAVVARTPRRGWPDPTAQAARLPTDTEVVVLVTSHRLLFLATQGGNHVGEPYLGVGPHNLLALELRVTSPVSAEIAVTFLDGTIAELTTAWYKVFPRLKIAFERLLPALDGLPR